MRFRTVCMSACIVVLLLSISSTSHAQFPWQKPPPGSKKAVANILGPTTEKEPSRDLHIDNFAKSEVILNNHVSVARCSASRASLMTGRHYARMGALETHSKALREWQEHAALPMGFCQTASPRLERHGRVWFYGRIATKTGKTDEP